MSACQTPALAQCEGNTVHTSSLKTAAAGSLRGFALCHHFWHFTRWPTTSALARKSGVRENWLWLVGPVWHVTPREAAGQPIDCALLRARTLAFSPSSSENLTKCQVVTLKLGGGAPKHQRGHWSLESIVHRCHDCPAPPALISAGASPSPPVCLHFFLGGGGGCSRSWRPFSVQVVSDSA